MGPANVSGAPANMSPYPPGLIFANISSGTLITRGFCIGGDKNDIWGRSKFRGLLAEYPLNLVGNPAGVPPKFDAIRQPKGRAWSFSG